MATDKSDQPGVLGNLPRSRPGQRSEKRAASRAAVAATAAKPAARSGQAPKRKPASAAPRREHAVPEPAATSPDPLTAAFHLAGKVAELGLKTAGGILRRLPGR